MIFPAINLHLVHGFPIATLWSFNVAMKSVPFICSMTHLFKNGDVLVRKLLNCQTATIHHQKKHVSNMLPSFTHIDHYEPRSINHVSDWSKWINQQKNMKQSSSPPYLDLAPQWMEASRILGGLTDRQTADWFSSCCKRNPQPSLLKTKKNINPTLVGLKYAEYSPIASAIWGQKVTLFWKERPINNACPSWTRC